MQYLRVLGDFVNGVARELNSQDYDYLNENTQGEYKACE